MNIKEAVEYLLKTRPILRDDDPALYCEVVRHLKIRYTSLYEALTNLSYQSVRAFRQNLQMNDENLRWKSYEKRQRFSQKKKKEFRRTYRQRLFSYLKD